MVDLTKIDEQIKRLQEIRRIAADPEAVAILKQVLNGAVDATAYVPKVRSGRKGSKRSLQRGWQVKAVRKAVASANSGFTVGVIGDNVRQSGSEITNIAVGKVLRRLTDHGEIRVIHQGIGNDPNTYERTEKFTISERSGR